MLQVKFENVSFSSESFMQRLIFCLVGVNFLINLFGKGCVVYCPIWQHAVAATDSQLGCRLETVRGQKWVF
jgi:hypothetical protein